MDEKLSQLLGAIIGVGAQRGSDLNSIIDRNLTQGLGVIAGSILHEKGSVSDDSGLAMALNTASRIPRSGALPVG